MKKLISISIACVFSLSIMAQQRYFDEKYVSTQSFVNPILINPGATGFDQYHHVIADYRSKWSTFPDAPKTFLLSYDGPVGNGLGLGAMLLTDNAGALETTKAQGSLSYKIESPTNKVSFGLSAEYIQHGVKSSVLSNAILDNTDPYLLQRLDGANFFDATFGIFGLFDNSLVYGITLPSLLNSKLEGDETALDERDFGYIVHLGYRLQANADLEIEPSIIIKSLNQIPTHIDANILMRFLDEKFTGGLTYSVGADNRLGFLIGTRINSFNFYYSYNVSRRDFQSYNNGSHEVSVRFDIGRSDNMSPEPVEFNSMDKMDSSNDDEIMKGTKLLKDK